jgi:hypothetical protein
MGSDTAVVVVGGLTVRKADVLSGEGMTREANAGSRKAAGIPTANTGTPSRGLEQLAG